MEFLLEAQNRPRRQEQKVVQKLLRKEEHGGLRSDLICNAQINKLPKGEKLPRSV